MKYLLILLVLASALVGCGQKEDVDNTPPSEKMGKAGFGGAGQSVKAAPPPSVQ